MILLLAVDTIRHLMGTTSLANSNSNKILELEDELSSSLRELIAGRDELEIIAFADDEVRALHAVATRLSMLFGFRDMTGWMEEDEGGKQSSAWDIFTALADRGGLGYKEEEEVCIAKFFSLLSCIAYQLVDQCLQLLTLHIVWKGRRLLASSTAVSPGSVFFDLLQEQRKTLLEKLTQLTTGSLCKPCEVVARSVSHGAFRLRFLTRDTGVQESDFCLRSVRAFRDDRSARFSIVICASSPHHDRAATISMCWVCPSRNGKVCRGPQRGTW